MGPELKTRAPKFKFQKGWFSFSKGRSQIWLQVTQPSVEIFRNPVVFWGEARSACPKYMAKFGDFFPSKKKGILKRNIPFKLFNFWRNFAAEKRLIITYYKYMVQGVLEYVF
jgi:lipopolysaccharide assembly outer membrane protein LptD (OstA)